MKNSVSVLKAETKRDLAMLEHIGLKKGDFHWNSVSIGLQRLEALEAELRERLKEAEHLAAPVGFFSNSYNGIVTIIREVLGEVGDNQ